jgi:hypothetical protein
MTSNFYLEIAISAEIGNNSDDVFSDRSAQKPMGLVAPFLLDIGHCCPATSDQAQFRDARQRGRPRATSEIKPSDLPSADTSLRSM